MGTPRQDPKRSEPTPYDFQRPTTLSREHSRILDVAFDTFSRQLSSLLTTRLHTKTTVSAEPASLTTYSAYTSSLPSHTTMMLLVIEGAEARGVFQLPLATTVDWVSRMMGSNGEPDVADRQLTGTEIRVLRGVLAGAMDDLAYSFMNVLDGAPVPENAVHYNPGFAQAAGPNELMVGASLAVSTGSGDPISVSLFLPAAVVMSRLGSSTRVDAEQDAPRLVMEQVGHTPLEVLLEAKKVKVSSVDILRLAVGDVIGLGQASTDPFHVTVDGTRLASATPVVSGSRKYMSITETEFTDGH